MFSQIPAVAGRVYHAPGAYLTLLAAADTAYAVPFVPPRGGMNFDQIGLRVTTQGAGANCDVRLGIYHDDGRGRPGQIVQDYGAIAALTSAAAFKVDVSNPGMRPMLWGGHLYWLVAAFDGAASTQPTVAAVGATAVSQALSAALGSASLAALPSAATAGMTGLTASHTFGALPEFGSSLTWSAVATAMPLVGLRAS